MAQVVLLKGVNVGGHRTFRPSVLARELAHLGAVNVGATGTFVARMPVSRAVLRGEIESRLPFQAHIMICRGSDILRLAAAAPFAGHTPEPAIVQFASLMAKRRPPPSPLPLDIPAQGAWGLRVLACHGRFVLGLYRRQMKAIGYLGQLEKLFGVPLTTRSWSTVMTVARILRS